jgi:hypothetical protein
MAGMGIKRVRIANLLPEVKEQSIRTALTTFVTVPAVIEELWTKMYRYKAQNGVRQFTVTQTPSSPSQLTMDWHRELLSFEGQEATFY